MQSVVDQHEVGFAKVAQPIRIAVTGSSNSPSIDQTLSILGRDVSMVRLAAAKTVFERVLAAREGG